MKFFIDAQLPPRLCGWLQARGHAATHVVDVGMLAAADAEIADMCVRDGLVLVSKDEDFLVLRLPNRFAMLWLRCGNCTNATLLNWLEPRWQSISDLLEGGERLIEVR